MKPLGRLCWYDILSN